MVIGNFKKYLYSYVILIKVHNKISFKASYYWSVYNLGRNRYNNEIGK